MFGALILLAILVPMLSGVAIKFLKTDRNTVAKISLACLAGGATCALMSLLSKSGAEFTLLKLTENVSIRVALDGMRDRKSVA